jgi:Spy/CpxP family protein refolding chaperone
MRIRTIGICVLALCLAAGTAAAMGDGMMHGKGGRGGMLGGSGMFFPGMLRNLDLTQQQRQQVRDILSAHRDKFRSLATQLRATHKAIADKLYAPGTVNQSDLDAQIQQAAQIRTQLMQEGMAVALQVRGVLTPDQIAKAAAMRTKMESLRAQMHELMGGKNQGGDE